jgi:hypothetical protein
MKAEPQEFPLTAKTLWTEEMKQEALFKLGLTTLISDAALARITELQAECNLLSETLEFERRPKCFSCGAKVTEPCPRAEATPCGREHLGGTRQALAPPRGATLAPIPQAMRDVLAEWKRLQNVKTLQYALPGDLARAAACYALSAAGYRNDDVAILRFWPWIDQLFAPTTPRDNLVQACVLILAEIERLNTAG